MKRLKSQLKTPETKFSAQRRFIYPRGTRAETRDKDRRWRKRRKGKGTRDGKKINKGEGKRGTSWGGGGGGNDKELSLDREKTDEAHRKMIFYKDKRGTPPVRMRCLILIGHVN